MPFKNTDLIKIAGKYKTPCFVLSERRIVENYQRIYCAFSNNIDTRVHYACKANTAVAVLKILNSLGSYIDAVSIGEVFLCKKAGFSSDRILFTGTNPSDTDLKLLSNSGVTINIDSESQLDRLAKFTTKAKLSVRVNPGIEAGHHRYVMTGIPTTKFGVSESQALELYKKALRYGFDIRGVHAHIGSGIMNAEPYLLLVEKLCVLCKKIEGALGISIEFIDIGGGFGIPYRPEEKPIDIEHFAKTIVSKLNEFYTDKVLCIEPGRYIVADAEVLLTEVNTIKKLGKRTFVGVDAGFNNLIRPALYGSYHHIEIVGDQNKKPTSKYTVAGQLCESGDVFAEDRPLPKIKEGDILAVHDVGAYGFSMSSRYNSKPLPPEILITKNGKTKIIREKETLADLLTHQKF